MNAKLLLALVVLLTLPFAGCMSDDEPESDGSDTDTPLLTDEEGDNLTVENGTLVDKGTPLDDAEGGDAGSRAHKHDYWGGKTEIVLVDGTYNPEWCLRGGNAATFNWGCFDVTMGNGSVVYQGTKLLTVMATWNDPKITGLAFDYADAFTYHPESIPLQSGVAYEIPVDPATADMPHTKESMWYFSFQGSGTGVGVAMASVDIVITIYRGLDLPLDPAHPEFWGNGTTVRDLGTATGTQSSEQATFLEEDTREPIRLPPGSIVPPGTGLLEIHFSWEVKDPASGVRYDVYPTWKSAKNSWYQWAYDADVDQAQREGVFYIEVDPDMTDSPYATMSQWAFLLDVQYGEGTTGFPLILPEFGGPNPFARDIDYSFHILAYKANEDVQMEEEEEDDEDDR